MNRINKYTFIFVLIFLLISCGGGRTALTKEDTVSNDLNQLPKEIALNYLTTNFSFKANVAIIEGSTNCKFSEDSITLYGKNISVKYNESSFVVLDRSIIISNDTSETCILKLKPSNLLLKTGSALDSLGIKSKGGTQSIFYEKKDIVSNSLNELPKDIALNYLNTKFSYIDKVKYLDLGYTNCKFNDDTIEVNEYELGRGFTNKRILKKYTNLKFMYKNKTFLILANFGEIGNCIIRHKPIDKKLKIGSALSSLGVKSGFHK